MNNLEYIDNIGDKYSFYFGDNAVFIDRFIEANSNRVRFIDRVYKKETIIWNNRDVSSGQISKDAVEYVEKILKLVAFS